MKSQRDEAKLWHDGTLGGIDLLCARFTRHSFGRHAHPELVIAVIEHGAERFDAQGSERLAPAGSVLVIPPNVAHTGCAATKAGWSYRAFYPSVQLLSIVQQDLFGDSFDIAALPLMIIRDGPLHARLLQTHQILERDSDPLNRSAALIGTIGDMLRKLLPQANLRTRGQESRAVLRARDYLHAAFGEAIDAIAVAEVTGLSVAHLMRAFQKQIGVPINVYLTTVRLAKARELLLAGESAAEIAAAVGFVDQSHLIRRFRGAYGVTPARYVRDSRIVQ
jgi:AraC-like DNA-binding protein